MTPVQILQTLPSSVGTKFIHRFLIDIEYVSILWKQHAELIHFRQRGRMKVKMEWKNSSERERANCTAAHLVGSRLVTYSQLHTTRT